MQPVHRPSETTSNVLCVCALAPALPAFPARTPRPTIVTPLLSSSREESTRRVALFFESEQNASRFFFLQPLFQRRFRKQLRPALLLNFSSSSFPFPPHLFNTHTTNETKTKTKKTRTAPPLSGPPSSSASATPSPRGPWAPTGSPGSPTPSRAPSEGAGAAAGAAAAAAPGRGAGPASSSSTPASLASSQRRSRRAWSGAWRPARGASSACS